MHITQTITIDFEIDFEEVARAHNITPQSNDDNLYNALEDEMAGHDDLEYYAYDYKDLGKKFREWLAANA